jgi:hypothetical protein
MNLSTEPRREKMSSTMSERYSFSWATSWVESISSVSEAAQIGHDQRDLFTLTAELAEISPRVIEDFTHDVS